MKYHIVVKFIAIVLATVFLAAAVGSGIGIIAMVGSGLYEKTVDNLYEEDLTNKCHSLAVNLAHRYASLELGGIPESYLDYYWGDYYWLNMFEDGLFFYTLRDYQGNVLETTFNGDAAGAKSYEIEITDLYYRQMVSLQSLTDSKFDFGTAQDETYVEERVEQYEGTVVAESPAVEDAVYSDVYYDYETEQTMEIIYRQLRMGKCTVTVYLLEGALEAEGYWNLLREAYLYRYHLIWILAVSLLLFAACVVYLCCAAGQKPGRAELRAGGLNRIPLDIYLGIGILAEILLVAFGWEAMEYLIRYESEALLPIGALFVLAASLVLVAFSYAFVAQIKTGRGFWWRNSVIGKILRLIWRGIRWIGKACGRFLNMLPAIWQFVVIALGMGLVMFITWLLAFGSSYYRINGFFALLLLVEAAACVIVMGYCLYAFGVLKKGAANMAKGDLRQLVPTKYLIGPFRTFAWELNRLSGAARRAAEQQLKSERMKTELITNVSHDIKTPLTSIINYVDLLEKPHTEAEGAEYLTVLSRQSQRLKKLVDDLMDMSKASTGNMAVETTKLDAAEAVKQALGEFSDKLEKASLIPVLRCPEKPVYVLADGRHVWRVLSNLLGNVVKYALPGTRVYLDMNACGGQVMVSIKNISREELNVSADELTERFVRGDASRNTEGSGLGLNIAKSLMELQQGSLELAVDGDLFKVTLTFPGTE